MDLFVDGGDLPAVRRLRREIGAYLSRHAVDGSDLEAAELVVDEVIANAVRHSGGPAWVSLEWAGEHPELTVRDLGDGFDLADVEGAPDPLGEHGRGLFLVAHLASRLEVARRAAGGAHVSVTLPVSRRILPEVRPEPVDAGLPAPDEATADGTFGKEPFLRALVVQLAYQIERTQGPQAAEAAIAGVGLSVGGRMEAEYRRIEQLTGPLTPAQMGELYVRLKHAIDGDFSVIEADEEKVVLANRRCPFGEAVRRAPALCRMTSSVFGGIAARNRGAGGVMLEERIAVGDHGCRVVVWLKEPPAPAGRFVHRYDAD